MKKDLIVQTAAGYHNKLIAKKDIILADIANCEKSSEVIGLLKKLDKVESMISTIRTHFGDKDKNAGETKENPSVD